MNIFDDEQILNYLMTSEFDEGLTPDEYKFLLQKFRNFYRITSCSINNFKDRMDDAVQKKEQMEKILDSKITEFNNEKSDLINKLNKLREKKLTFKERVLGKIIEKDEN